MRDLGEVMKKHRDANELAKRIMEAASKPPGITPQPIAVPEPAPVKVEATRSVAEPVATPAPVKFEKAEEEPRAPKKSAKREAKKKAANDDTVAMSLRPPRGIYERYVMAAANRTLAVGRVVSVQDMILEVMERGL